MRDWRTLLASALTARSTSNGSTIPVCTSPFHRDVKCPSTAAWNAGDACEAAGVGAGAWAGAVGSLVRWPVTPGPLVYDSTS